MNQVLVSRLRECDITPSDILSRIKGHVDEQAVFVYTSQLEGLGTKDSDFDVYVLSEDIPNDEGMRKEQNYKVQIDLLNGKLLDIEYWNIKFVQDLINSISSSNCKMLSLEELKLIHRLKIAEIISEGEVGVEVKRWIQNSNLKELVIRHYLVCSNSNLQDAIALYGSKEYISALNCGRIALENAIGALNAKNGFTNLKEKWIPKIFINNRGYDKELLDSYLHYQIYCNVNSENIESFVENMLEFTQSVMSRVAI